ncbi:TatD protein [Schizosaccharomyces cryophilus OY26]|uniref:TatD protein n=1 Tax=Schizosaccharomyces cryophilus (strain OY26 / ATCC MYA-4695 / CBS 11777 / NBRC 106824 / NRRL Y48691) TaxID=653667 RepID=S9VMQ1_SCHCR|nr:TatD protein [Schizosaccharomyces cryophilus OY26]EPY49248.1 TatD protein [Schizosaccharomyces cryophilus OY26]
MAQVKQAIQKSLRFYDIGFNATDPVFRGFYHEKQRHVDDFDAILSRALSKGVQKMMITGDNVVNSREALKLANQHDSFTCTIGVHPCQAECFNKNPQGPEDYLHQLEALVLEGKKTGRVAAFGEFGLDYDRLHYAPAEVQKTYFEEQLKLAVKMQLPLFLHSRNAAKDFFEILEKYLPNLPKKGVVHSFTGTIEEMQQCVDHDLYVGVNGCSLKTPENVAVVKAIPLDKMLLETDAPWCEIRPSHAGHAFLDSKNVFDTCKKERFKEGCMVKGRNEPCNTVVVAEAVAKIKGIDLEELADKIWENSISLLG